MQTSALVICLPVSVAAFGLFGKFAFDMKRDGNERASWGWSFWAILPGFLSAVYLTSNPEVDVALRNLILGSLGGAVGMCAAVWLGYALTAHSVAQPYSSSQSPVPQIGDNNTTVNVPVPGNMGSGNTLVGPTDSNGNTIYNRGGTAIGAGACADPTSVAIGAGANAGACAKKP